MKKWGGRAPPAHWAATALKNMYIVGDLNINTLDYTNNNQIKCFINSLYKNGYLPTICKPN